MAGRDKKTKSLNAARESPTTAGKHSNTVTVGATSPQGKADGLEADNTQTTQAGKRKPPVGIKSKLAAKKGRPIVKIKVDMGKKKTKANFKLNIIKSQNRKNMIVKEVRRGRPSLQKKPVIKEEPVEEEIVEEDGGTKTRGRKRGTAPDPAAEEAEKPKAEAKTPASKSPSPKKSDNKKTAIKGVPKKKKVMLIPRKSISKDNSSPLAKALKAEAIAVDPKVLKTTLTAKLKSAAEKLEAKKELEKTSAKASETAEPMVVDAKKDVDGSDASPTVSNSRSSSPRTGGVGRRCRTSSDLLMTKTLMSDIAAASLGTSATLKPAVSTRSERSRSPFPLTTDPIQKMLRNGKQRRANTLLNDTMEQELKKKRLTSDLVTDASLDGEDVKKPRRLRSYSRDGSEVSKCSDVTESDLSFCDGASLDIESNKLENKLDTKDAPKAAATSLIDESSSDIISEEISTEPSQTPKCKVAPLPEDAPSASKAPVKAEAESPEETAPSTNRSSMDNENNNTDGKPKTDSGSCPDNTTSETDDSVSIQSVDNEKLPEKSFILDNMSKTFNETALSENSKLIRRSTRRRKTTAKVKEHEEMVLAEKDGIEFDVKPLKTLKADQEEVPKGKPDVDPLDSSASKISTQKFYGATDKATPKDKNSDKPTLNVQASKVVTKVEVLSPTALVPALNKDPEVETCKISDSDGLKLRFDDDDASDVPDKVDDSLKENIESGYSSKTFTHQDIDKLIDKLKNFEEQDRKRQEEIQKLNTADKHSVMVTNDVVLISKSNMEHKALKDIPNTVTIEKAKEKENVLSCFENNSAISIVKMEQPRRSFDIDLPSSVTLIKRSGSTSRKHSTSSNSDSVTMFDKTLGKEVTLELRKSIDKASMSIEPITLSKNPILTNNQSLSISVKTIPSKETTLKPVTPILIPVVPVKLQQLSAPIAPQTAPIINKPAAVSCPDVEIAKESLTPDAILTVTPIPITATPQALSKTTPEALIIVPPAITTVKVIPCVQPANINVPETPIPPVITIPPVVPTPSLVESPEKQKQKENILRTLGLLTLKEADEAKLEKQKQKELVKSKTSEHKLYPGDGYTGTLKTVIKLNKSHSEKKKARSSLKMTFQKKSRTTKLITDGLSGESESDENSYYTIHKEHGGSLSCGTAGWDSHATGGLRKTHYSNRFNNNDLHLDPLGDLPLEAGAASKETPLVIPEKASSFGIHPGRLCLDQCFYCGGKFGLYDTPCHVAQIKPQERQKKILDNEEKLTVDSCLCDACYRHVDRRANCPSYKRRSGPGAAVAVPGKLADLCHAGGCRRPAPRTLRRKWLVKMRKSIAKVVELDLDYPGLHTIPLCDLHYKAISHLMICGLCKRRLSRTHVHYINQEFEAINPLLKQQGLPIVFEEKPVVCKGCRYFCTLLQRPQLQTQPSQIHFFTTHKQRLFQAYKLDLPDDLETENPEHEKEEEAVKEQPETREKKKTKNGKSKTKKGEHKTDENQSKIPEQWKLSNNQEKSSTQLHKAALEEDIESLISTNKIPVSNLAKAAMKNDGKVTTMEISDGSDGDLLVEYDNPLIAAMDKQSELQLLLQKRNVPSSTILQRAPVPSLTAKSRNILKLQNTTAICKPAHNQKTMDKNAKRIQKLGQIITQKNDANVNEHSIDAGTTGAGDKILNKELTGLSILRHMALNEECTIETIPPKSTSKLRTDINQMKSKWLATDSFNQVKKNLSVLSKNLPDQRKKVGQQTDLRSNPVRRLETNPSISVRELFPGEEEMNLQCSIDFGNIKGVTPEGWEKCSTTIQYDSDTKRMWHDLQKPYGNQSSFLRHLILLEKYFRSGDLILSQNATSSAITYSDSVQNRLRSYDNLPSNGESSAASLASASQMMLPKNSSITLIPHNSSPPPPLPPETILETVRKSDSTSLIDFRKQKNPNQGKSLLKTNQAALPDYRMMVGRLPSPFMRPGDLLPPSLVNQAKIPKNVPISIAQINQSVDQSLKQSKKLPFAQLEKMTYQLPEAPAPAANRPPTPRPSTPRPPTQWPELPKPPKAWMEPPKQWPDITKPAMWQDLTKPATWPDFSKQGNEFMRPPSLPASLAFEAKTDKNKGASEGTPSKPRAPSIPPELIAISHTQTATNKKSIADIVQNIHQKAKNSSTPIKAQSIPSAIPEFSPILPATEKPAEVLPQVVSAETTKKTKGSSKQWRPTLIPITDESKLRNARDVLYQTADGRRLPSLVQVMSGGKPYHISIQDYNRMCVMRREKLQQMQKAEMTKKQPSPSVSITETTAEITLNTTATITSLPNLPASITVTSEKPASDSAPKPAELNTVSVTAAEAVDSVEDSAASILKNVGLKNVTIAPVSSAENKACKSPPAIATLSSLLITPTKTTLDIPSIMQLNPGLSVTTESPLNTSSLTVVAAKALPVAITSQAVIIPKIPKSLTVIPQAANASALSASASNTPLPSVSPTLPPPPPPLPIALPPLAISSPKP